MGARRGRGGHDALFPLDQGSPNFFLRGPHNVCLVCWRASTGTGLETETGRVGESEGRFPEQEVDI